MHFKLKELVGYCRQIDVSETDIIVTMMIMMTIVIKLLQ